jgi:hypothetical protein
VGQAIRAGILKYPLHKRLTEHHIQMIDAAFEHFLNCHQKRSTRCRSERIVRHNEVILPQKFTRAGKDCQNQQNHFSRQKTEPNQMHSENSATESFLASKDRTQPDALGKLCDRIISRIRRQTPTRCTWKTLPPNHFSHPKTESNQMHSENSATESFLASKHRSQPDALGKLCHRTISRIKRQTPTKCTQKTLPPNHFSHPKTDPNQMHSENSATESFLASEDRAQPDALGQFAKDECHRQKRAPFHQQNHFQNAK